VAASVSGRMMHWVSYPFTNYVGTTSKQWQLCWNILMLQA